MTIYDVRRSHDGALAVRDCPTRYRADGRLAAWSVVYAPITSAEVVPTALTDHEVSAWVELVPVAAPTCNVLPAGCGTRSTSHTTTEKGTRS